MIDQVGMLMSTTPPGCIQTNEVLTMGLNATCFDSVKLNATNSTGCPGGGITFNGAQSVPTPLPTHPSRRLARCVL